MMGTIHILEIQKILKERAKKEDCKNFETSSFLEILFNNPKRSPGAVDEEFKNKVITADCAYGSVTIVFDDYGELKSIDIS